MAIDRIQLYQSNQDPNNRQVYISSPNGQVDIFRIDQETLSRLAGLGIPVQQVGNTYFQPAYGGELYKLSGQAAFDKLKEFATSPSDLPDSTRVLSAFDPRLSQYPDLLARSQESKARGGNGNVNLTEAEFERLNPTQQYLGNRTLFSQANFSNLPTTGGDVVTPGVNDAQTLMTQGKASFGGRAALEQMLLSKNLPPPTGGFTTLTPPEGYLDQFNTASSGQPGSVGAASTQDGASLGRKLGPTEFERLRIENNVSPANFDQFFARDSAGNIYLKPTAPNGLGSSVGAGTTGSQTGTGTSGSSTTPGSLTDLSKIPQEILNSAEFKSLPTDLQSVIALTYNSLASGSEAQKADANKALEEAIKLADPSFRSAMRVAQDEIIRATASNSADAASQVSRLQDRINQTNEDLKFNRDQLSLEQQADLSKQLRDYQAELEDLSQSFAESGLAFSSPRALAEKRLSQQQTDIAESTNRRYARSLRELETGSLRSIQDAAANIADVTRKAGENAVSISRAGEKALGSGQNVPVPGVSELGGITGTIEQDRQANILNLEQALLGRTGAALPF